MNQREVIFRRDAEYVPGDKYEAAVFVQTAIQHLLNSGRSWTDAAVKELSEAHGRINQSFFEEKAA
jgi:hypothetical protein